MFAKMMMLISTVLNSLLTLLILLCYSFVGVSSPLQMFLRESGTKGLLSLGGMLYWSFGVLYVVMVRAVLFLLFILGMPAWFLQVVFDSLGLLNDFLKQVVVSRRDIGFRKWTRWLREDLGSRPYVWLRPDFVPPSPFLIVKDPQTHS